MGTVKDLIARGDALMASGRFAAALDEYEAATAMEPFNGEAVASAALALGKLGRAGEGVDRLRRAVGERHWDTAGLIWLAIGLCRLGADEDALALAREVTEKHRDGWCADLSLATDLATLWLTAADASRALEVMDAAGAAGGTTTADANVRAAWARGRCLAELGRNLEALDAYAAALTVEPENAQVLLDSAVTLQVLGRRDDALERATRCQSTGGLDTGGRLRLVDVFEQLGADPDAHALLRELADSDECRSDRELAFEVALRWSSRDPAEAVAVLDTALADASWAASDDASPAIKLRAVCLAATGDAARAAADFDALRARGVRVDRPNDRAWAGLSYAKLGQHEKALACLDGIAGSVAEGLRTPVLLYTGIALVQAGKPAEAVSALRDVLARTAEPGDDAAAIRASVGPRPCSWRSRSAQRISASRASCSLRRIVSCRPTMCRVERCSACCARSRPRARASGTRSCAAPMGWRRDSIPRTVPAAPTCALWLWRNSGGSPMPSLRWSKHSRSPTRHRAFAFERCGCGGWCTVPWVRTRQHAPTSRMRWRWRCRRQPATAPSAQSCAC